MFLLMVVNANALDTLYASLEESEEEIANLSKYSGMELRELTEREVLIVRRSLCDVGIAVCIFGILGGSIYIIGYYRGKKKSEKE